MFEAAEVGNTLSAAAYERLLPQLRVDLINAQYDLSSAGFPVLLVLAGDDRVGCNEVLNVLHEWMDARYLQTHALRAPSDEELERPRFWRFWRTLPRRGQLAVYVGSWAQQAVVERVRRRLGERAFATRLEHIVQFERTLIADGALILKFWLHLSKKEHKKRLKRAKRLDERDGQIVDLYDRGVPIAERLLRETSHEGAPWHVVEATDARFRDVTVARTLLDALTGRLSRPTPRRSRRRTTGRRVAKTVLAAVDLSRTLSRKRYRARLERLQADLARLSRRAVRKPVTSVLVLEGWDAAGKGGVIRRLTRAMDARDYRVVPVAAPTEEEAAHHYLWRFWRQLPRAGTMVIFDRSWYGRVLVERVEGLAPADAWRRAYDEINDFEQQLVEHGVVVCKFWLHIDRRTQLARFRAREHTPYKKYKITAEDYRNRERWEAYVEAIHEMVEHTSTEHAPWALVPANDKRWARVAVLDTVRRGLKRALRAR